jgi:hypothetical protein
VVSNFVALTKPSGKKAQRQNPPLRQLTAASRPPSPISDVMLRPVRLVKIGAHIIHAPREDSFAPGYYSVLFENPDGTRLEINYVPGKGLLAPGIQIGDGYADGTQNG